MQLLKSRFRFSYEHTGVLIAFVFAAMLTIKLVIDPYDKHGRNIQWPLVLVSLVGWSLFGYTIYRILKIPLIIISEDGILFKTFFSTRNTSWRDVETITLTDKKKSGWPEYEEASTLILKTGEKIFVQIAFYKNSPEIRRLLNTIKASLSENKPATIDPLLFLPVSTTKHSISTGEGFVKYAGTPYIHFLALLFYGLFIGLVVAVWPTVTRYPERIPILIIPVIAFYLGLGYFLHYFLVSNNYIIIRNAFWLWKKHVYSMDEVEDIAFEVWGGKTKSNSLRITTKDFKTKLYPAAGLWKKDWKKLKAHFESSGIKIRDYINV